MNRKIMVVDDEEEIRSLVKEVFKGGPYEVMEVASAAALRRLFEGAAPDVVLLDLKLADASGLVLLPELRKAWPGSKIIVLTGYGTVEAAEEAFKQGDLFLQSKPFDSEMLRTLVEMAINQESPK